MLSYSNILEQCNIPYIQDENGKCHLVDQTNIEKAFDFFSDNMYIPKGKTGKNTHTYIDEERSGKIKDYRGEEAEYHELSSVHLEESDYSLSSVYNLIKELLEMSEGGI